MSQLILKQFDETAQSSHGYRKQVVYRGGGLLRGKKDRDDRRKS